MAALVLSKNFILNLLFWSLHKAMSFLQPEPSVTSCLISLIKWQMFQFKSWIQISKEFYIISGKCYAFKWYIEPLFLFLIFFIFFEKLSYNNCTI